VIVEGEGAVLGGEFGVSNEDFATQLFPNYFGQDLLLEMLTVRIFVIILHSYHNW